MKNFTSKALSLAALALTMATNANAQAQEANMGLNNKISLPGTHRTNCIFGDFDNNGKMDVYYGGQIQQGGLLDNKPGIWNWEPLSHMIWQQTDASIVKDIDGVTCVREANPENPDDKGEWTFAPAHHGIFGNTYAVYATLDYNNDGLVDLIVNGTPTSDYYSQGNPGRPFMRLYKNNGDQTFSLVEEAVFPYIYTENSMSRNEKNEVENNWLNFHKSIAVGDYDHDGYTDILVTGDLFYDDQDGGFPSFCAVKLFHNEGGSGVFKEMLIAQTNETPKYISVTNNDVTKQANDGTVHENGEAMAEGSFMPMRGNVAFADLNNDGWLDIVAIGTLPEAHDRGGCVGHIYLNEQGKSFKEVTPETNSYFDPLRHGPINIADFDNDGYLDLFMTGWSDTNGASASLYYNTTSADKGFFEDVPAYASELGLANVEKQAISVTDLNGDGILDIIYSRNVGIQEGENWKWYNGYFYGNASGTFDLGPDWNNSCDGAVCLGDFTGNGLCDIYRNGWVWADITPNNSEAPKAPEAPTKVNAEMKDGKLVVTWEYDEYTANEKGLAFNIFVKAGDKLFTLLPADPETGFLRVSQDKHTALRATVREYVMDAPAAAEFTVGVQTISNYNETYSAFVTTDVSTGISNIKNNETAAPVYYNIQGMKVSEPKAGQVYVRKQGNKAEKFITK